MGFFLQLEKKEDRSRRERLLDHIPIEDLAMSNEESSPEAELRGAELHTDQIIKSVVRRRWDSVETQLIP